MEDLPFSTDLRPDQRLRLRPARAEECPDVTALCLRSKAVWGYDAAFMARCRDELTVTPDDLANTPVQVAERNGQVVGIVQISLTDGRADLEKLFVDPDAMGSGIGRALMTWAKTTAAALGATELVIEADPDAAPFYRRQGRREGPISIDPRPGVAEVRDAA